VRVRGPRCSVSAMLRRGQAQSPGRRRRVQGASDRSAPHERAADSAQSARCRRDLVDPLRSPSSRDSAPRVSNARSKALRDVPAARACLEHPARARPAARLQQANHQRKDRSNGPPRARSAVRVAQAQAKLEQAVASPESPATRRFAPRAPSRAIGLARRGSTARLRPGARPGGTSGRREAAPASGRSRAQAGECEAALRARDQLDTRSPLVHQPCVRHPYRLRQAIGQRRVLYTCAFGEQRDRDVFFSASRINRPRARRHARARSA